MWETNLGGSNNDASYSILQTIDGGYIAAGRSESDNGDVGGNNGNKDSWILKLDAAGNLIWETNLGGSNWDQANTIQQLTDGNYIVAGHSDSNDGDVGGNNGFSDFWILKLDTNGNLIWESNFGGSNWEQANDIQLISENNFIVTGFSDSNNGDVGNNNGSADFWVLRLESILSIEENSLLKNITITPNPVKDVINFSELPEKITKIEISDMQGRVILVQKSNFNNTIEINNFQSATYIVRIYSEVGILVKKFIKI